MRLVLSCLCLILTVCFSASEDLLKWRLLDNKEAVCNDFSRAGYFIERRDTSKWIIFLESGGLCYSAESCNRRFIHPSVREEFSVGGKNGVNSNLNITRAWVSTADRRLSSRISPFMTSINTSIDTDTGRFLTISGRDILDSDVVNNPVFHNYSRVIIPYCSSDAWLGNDTRINRSLTDSDDQANFLNTTYRPESTSLQFTFRGLVIFRSVMNDLLQREGLANASEVFLSGSSAGGIGAVNHAKWVMEQLSNETNLSIITDSAWFINFHRNIYRRFNSSTSADADVFSIISAIPQCSNSDITSPCCIRLHCMLNSPEYFPVGKVPVLALFSLYDLFVLADTIAQTLVPGNDNNENDQPNLGIDFLRIVSEYGGAMNSSISTSLNIPALSFIVTECFQHIYFATSTLWNQDGGVFAESAVEELSEDLGIFNASYRHTIKSGVWSSYHFSGVATSSNLSTSSCNASDAATIRDAITMWTNCRYVTTLEFRDHCTSVHCNPMCPDIVDFGIISPDHYQWLTITVIVVVIFITAFSIVGKIIFYIWEIILSFKQTLYLRKITDGEEDRESCLPSVPNFPVCSIEEAVSVACVDLRYSIDIQSKKEKDEKADKTTVTLVIDDDIGEQQQEQKDISTSNLHTRSKTRRPSDWTAQFLYKRTQSSAGIQRKSINLENDEDMEYGHEGEYRPHDSTSSTPSPTSYADTPLGSGSEFKTVPSNGSSATTSTTLSNWGSQDSSNPAVPYNRKVDFLPSMPMPILEETDGVKEDERIHSQVYPSLAKPQTTPVSGLLSCGKVRKEILRGISLYFNPGELVGIMGPSGCGKTTFLDLLTGRRNRGNISGHIYINGYPLERVKKSFTPNTGYVLQLAAPYYEELTVRENLTLSAHMKLPKTRTWREKFERVEQVMSVTGLTVVQDTIVGGASGPGLSGGQKKRLVISLQLLTMPNVIFLDEPTSGLDATASIELLSHLNSLAYSNRTVVLTIHQPRFEIFYMFHKLILLSDGKVAYHGVPQKAYGFFVEALMNKFLNRGLLMPQLEEHNPADVIMDMLGKPWMREVILEHYQTSTEPELIKWAIKRARVLDFESMSIVTLEREGPVVRQLSDPTNINATKLKTPPQANWFVRQAVLEARASKKTSLIWKVYLPIIFFAYGFVLGTTYFQQDVALFVLSGFCVYSVASALFMFPVLQNYYVKALEVYGFEKADGAGRAHDLVIQGFVRFAAMAIIPVVFSAGILYLLLIKMTFWNGLVFFRLAVVNMALNQTWIALLTFIICAFPSYCARISPIVSSVAGFTSGFFIPRDETLWLYRWLFYINPNYYGFSAAANILLSDFNNDCPNADVECYLNSGNYILYRYNFDDINPFLHIAILLLMTLVFMMLAIFSNWLRHTTIKDKIRVFFRRSEKDVLGDDDSEISLDEEKGTDIILYHEEDEEEEEEEETTEDLVSLEREIDDVFESNEPSVATPQHKPLKVKWFQAVKSINKDSSSSDIEMESMPSKSPRQSNKQAPSESSPRLSSKNRPRNLNLAERKQRLRGRSCLLMEDQTHMVYQPSIKQPPTPGYQFASLVSTVVQQQNKECTATPLAAPRISLKERQQDFDWHVKTTQEVVKEKTEEIINRDEDTNTTDRSKANLRDVTKRLTQRFHDERQPKLALIVADAMAKLRASQPEEAQSNPAVTNYSPSAIANAWKQRAHAKKQISVLETKSSVVLIPVHRLTELKRRVSQNSLKPEPSPTVRFSDADEPTKPTSILKKSTSEKASSSSFSKFPGIEEESLASSSSNSFPIIPNTPEMPAHYFSGTEDETIPEIEIIPTEGSPTSLNEDDVTADHDTSSPELMAHLNSEPFATSSGKIHYLS